MILSNCRIFDGNILKEGQYNIYLEKDRIFDIKKYTYITDSIDIKGCIAVPGYIDIHTHGIHGMDFSYSSGIGTGEVCSPSCAMSSSISFAYGAPTNS